jgi:hypothetical protein
MVGERASHSDAASSDGDLGDSLGDTGWESSGRQPGVVTRAVPSRENDQSPPHRSAGPGLGRRQRMGSTAHSDAIPSALAGSNSFNDSIVGSIGDRRSHGHRRRATSGLSLGNRFAVGVPGARRVASTRSRARGMLPTVSRRTLSCRVVDLAAPSTVQA